MAISRAVCFSVPIPLLCCSQSWNRALVVLDSWDGFLPWQTERHRFALRHHPLLWEVSWALEQFLQSLPIIGLIPISIVTSPQRNLWLWLTSWNLPPHRFLIPGLMFLLIACDGMALISAWDRQGFRSHPIVMPSSDFWEMLKPVRPYVSLQMMAFFSITFGGKMLRDGTSNSPAP